MMLAIPLAFLGLALVALSTLSRGCRRSTSAGPGPIRKAGQAARKRRDGDPRVAEVKALVQA